jgi:signal transduction histidine kinase
MNTQFSVLMTRIGRWGRSKALTLTTVAVFLGTMAFSFGEGQQRMTVFSNVVTALLAAATSAASYQHPTVALSAVVVLCVGSPALSPSFAALELVVVFVLFQVVWRSDLSPGLVAMIGFFSLTVNDLWLRRINDLGFKSPTALYPLILTAFAVGLGYQGRLLRRQHNDLVTLQLADRERAVLHERQRIARDLHDVAAHHLSALVVQNKLARRVGTPRALEEAADFSAQTARDALDALRSVVGVLSTESPLDPQPTLNDLDPMFARLAMAGLHIHRRPQPDMDNPSVLRRDVELAIVRITQEALTNVLRHRGPGNAWFDLTMKDNKLLLSIEDDGAKGAPVLHGDRNSTGYGLINMSERATSTGGSFEIDDSPRGGWRIQATLPYGR